MISEPDRYLEAFVDAGGSRSRVHVETRAPSAPHDPRRSRSWARRRASRSTRPRRSRRSRTSRRISTHVLVMSVNPGFGGQTFIPRSESKVRARARAAGPRPAARRRSGSTAASMRPTPAGVVAAGADILVAGTRALPAARSRRGDPRRCARGDRGRRGVTRGADLASHASASATPRPTRWASSTTRTTSSGSRSARADLLRTLGWSYREMEHSGVSLPVIEAHCDYRRAGEVRRRDGSEDGRADAVAGADGVQLRGGRGSTTASSRRPAGPCTRRSIASGRPCRLPAARPRGVRVKALVTGAAGFIGSHLTASAARRGRRRRRHRLLHRLLPARDQGSATSRVNAGATGLPLRRSGDPGRGPPALLDGVTHVFHLAAQAGVRKSWGSDFQTYTENNVDATQRLLEACVGRPLERFVYASSSSVYGDARRIPMREDALPQPVSPYGVTKLAAEQLCHLYWVNHRVPTDVGALLHGVRAAAAARHGVPPLHPGGDRRGEPITLYGDGEQTRDFTFVTDAVAATIAAGERGVPGRAYNIGGGSRVSVNHVLEIIERIWSASRSTSRAKRRRRATCATPTPTRRWRARIWDSPRRCRSNRVSKRSIDGCRHCRRRLMACARVSGFTSCAARLALRSPCVGGAARDRCKKPPTGTPSPTSSCSIAAPSNSPKKHWLTAREYFRQLVDSYPQSPFRADAKLGRRRHLHGRRHRPSRSSWRPTSSGSS